MTLRLQVLRQIKTVRQFASEQRAAATYARRNLARQLIGESVTTLKRSLEMLVWVIFDTGPRLAPSLPPSLSSPSHPHPRLLG